MDTFQAVHDLVYTKVRRDARQGVGLVTRQTSTGDQVAHHVAGRLQHGRVEVLVEGQEDQVRLRLRAVASGPRP